jgi:flagellar biosynthesis protein FlhA
LWNLTAEAPFAVLVLLIAAMMVIPLPAEALDFLISLNLSLSLVVLLATLSVRRPLEFSSFPSLLVVTTLFRLALNVSSARLILLNGFAGYVINAFGSFVVGGNVLVGAIVFIILVVIQYIVITRGAERVSEVAARFTLDAMPGKQMAIDADLNAGVIDDAEARRRRQEIQREADFYGAMDGASKFVRGDAIAGMVILAVNIVGGLAVGVLMNGMALQDAVQRYTILTIGDGLVSQIPALLLSTATGLIVTRSSAEGNLGSLMSRQLPADGSGGPRGHRPHPRPAAPAHVDLGGRLLPALPRHRPAPEGAGCPARRAQPPECHRGGDHPGHAGRPAGPGAGLEPAASGHGGGASRHPHHGAAPAGRAGTRARGAARAAAG